MAAAPDRPGPPVRSAAAGTRGLPRERRRHQRAGDRTARTIRVRQDLARARALLPRRELPRRRRARDRGPGQELLAHPGTPVAGLDRLAPQSAGEVLATDDRERMVRVDGSRGRAGAPRRAVLPGAAAGRARRPRVRACRRPAMLLSATFNYVLQSPERLERLLEVCALAADTARRANPDRARLRHAPGRTGHPAAAGQRDVTRWLAGTFDPAAEPTATRLTRALEPHRRGARGAGCATRRTHRRPGHPDSAAVPAGRLPGQRRRARRGARGAREDVEVLLAAGWRRWGPGCSAACAATSPW